MDFSSLLSELKYLPDSILNQELSQPSGKIPGWAVLMEAADRKEIRSGGSGAAMPQKTVAQQYVQNFAEGGLVNAINPFIALTDIMQNPDLAGQALQDKLNQAYKGLPPLMPALPTQAAQAPAELNRLQPQPAGSPKRPDLTGLPSLMQGR